jgi:hypothetical protein
MNREMGKGGREESVEGEGGRERGRVLNTGNAFADIVMRSSEDTPL